MKQKGTNLLQLDFTIKCTSTYIPPIKSKEITYKNDPFCQRTSLQLISKANEYWGTSATLADYTKTLMENPEYYHINQSLHLITATGCNVIEITL